MAPNTQRASSSGLFDAEFADAQVHQKSKVEFELAWCEAASIKLPELTCRVLGRDRCHFPLCLMKVVYDPARQENSLLTLNEVVEVVFLRCKARLAK